MSYLRQGRGGENRRSVFYTGNSSTEEWELVDAPPKDFPEQKPHPDTHRRTSCCLIHTPWPEFNTHCIILLHSFAQFSTNGQTMHLSKTFLPAPPHFMTLLFFINHRWGSHTSKNEKSNAISLLSQIPSDQRSLSTLCATHRGLRSLCYET